MGFLTFPVEIYSHISPNGPSDPSQSPSAMNVIPGAGMLANAYQEVILSEVLVPGWVQKAMGSSEDPAVTDEAGPTQQFLGTLPEEHHLPTGEVVSISSWGLGL